MFFVGLLWKFEGYMMRLVLILIKHTL